MIETGPGGQAGSSSKIENYLGFHRDFGPRAGIAGLVQRKNSARDQNSPIRRCI